MAHVRQSRPDSGYGSQVNIRQTFQVFSSSLGCDRLVKVLSREPEPCLQQFLRARGPDLRSQNLSDHETDLDHGRLRSQNSACCKKNRPFSSLITALHHPSLLPTLSTDRLLPSVTHRCAHQDPSPPPLPRQHSHRVCVRERERERQKERKTERERERQTDRQREREEERESVCVRV